MNADHVDVDQLLAKARKPSADALRLHPFYRGKVQVLPKCPISEEAGFAVWYTPGVAASSKAVAARPELVYEHTNKANAVAIVTDGTRVLGLGDIGPEAALPVMEGKALLFKYLGGVDAVPICLATTDPDEIVATVLALHPAFGAVNLEDIAQPKCFRVLDRLRHASPIPVWHDDQQGTATVQLAGLLNALQVVGKELETVRIAMIGMGAANVAVFRLLRKAGIDPGNIIACDSQGILHKGRDDLDRLQDEYPEKWEVCTSTNRDMVHGGIAEALHDADVCIAYSTPGPGIIEAGWVAAMASDAIVFACANPVPEIWPWEAQAAGARVVATGRSDFPNQVNNSLGFPGIFRGVLDIRARTITDGMAIAAARRLARFAGERGLRDDYILPTMNDWEVVPEVAAATARAAVAEGVADLDITEEELRARARTTVEAARRGTALLMESGLIAPPPPGPAGGG